MTTTEQRERVLDRDRLPYEPPAVEILGSLRDLTRGAGPGHKPIVMTTGIGPIIAIAAPLAVNR
jgi:hypothetical protein